MWDYSEKVKEHFFNPRNSGVLDGANGVGDVGSISCGDALRLMLKVDPESEKILDARFQTFGCGSAIASSSALTEIIKGKTLDEALKVSNQEIADYLDGLPPEKMHCSALIEEVVRANGLTTVEQVTHYTKAGGSCATCHEPIEEILAKVAGERCAAPALEAKPVVVESPSTKPKLTNFQRMRKIEEVVESIRPMLQRDHGDIEIVEVDGRNIYVRLQGACQGCMMEQATLSGIQSKLAEALNEMVRVLPVAALPKTGT